MQTIDLQHLAIKALDDLKAQDIKVLPVAKLTSMTDAMVICSGTSSRHVKSLADNVIKAAKACGERPRGLEGEQEADWVLVDLGDVLVHIMQPETREFYNLEKLWEAIPEEKEAGEAS